MNDPTEKLGPDPPSSAAKGPHCGSENTLSAGAANGRHTAISTVPSAAVWTGCEHRFVPHRNTGSPATGLLDASTTVALIVVTHSCPAVGVCTHALEARHAAGSSPTAIGSRIAGLRTRRRRRGAMRARERHESREKQPR